MTKFFTLFLFFMGSLIGLSGQTTKLDTTRMTEEDILSEERYLQAVSLRIAGKFKQAIDIIESLIRKNGGMPAYYYELARNQYLDRQSAQAVLNSQTAARMEPDNIWYTLFAGEMLEKSGSALQAAELYETIVSRYPRVEEYWIKMSRLYDEANMPEKSIEVWDRMEKQFGPSEEIAYKRFQGYISINRISDAIKAMEQLVAMSPRNINYLTTLANLYKNNGRDHEATAVYKDVLALDPSNSRANLALAEGLKKEQKDDEYLGSIRTLLGNKDIALDAKVGELIPYLQKYVGNDDPKLLDALVNATEILINTHPEDPKPYALAGDVLFYGALYDQALEKYNSALKITNRVFSVFEQKMVILLYQKKFEELEMLTNQIIDIYPNQLTTYFNRSYSLLKLGKVQEAISLLSELELMVGKKNDQASRVAALQYIAYTASNDRKQAEKYYLKMDGMSLSAESAHNVGSVLADFKVLPDYALSKLQIAAEKRQQDAFTEISLASVYADTKDFKKALDWCEKSLSHGGMKYPTILETAGDIYFFAKNPSKALELWTLAKSKGVVSKKLDDKIASKQYVN